MEKSRNAAYSKAKQEELRYAIVRLDRKLARKLMIDEGVKPVNVETGRLIRFLYIAVQSRDQILVHEVLEQKLPLNNIYGSEILWIVAEDGNTEIATMLVCAGADLNSLRPFDEKQQSLLHVLIESNSPKKHQLAILMMDYGADLNAEDVNANSPLQYAISKGSFELVEELVSRGAAVNAYAIKEAISNPRSVEVMKILIRGDIDRAKTLKDKITTMLVYLSYCKIDETKILPSVEVLMDMETIEDDVVLFSAVVFGKYKMLEFYLDKGLGKDILSNLLHLSTSLEKSNVAELLIRRGADVNHRMQFQELGDVHQVPLHSACQNGSLPNLKLLLRSGAQVNVRDSEGRTPFLTIGDSEFNELHHELIKHFAILALRGLQIDENDMKLITKRADYLNFYIDCLSELDSMKELKLFNHITVYTILVEDIRKLSWLTRNYILVENYRKVKLQKLFPRYYTEINWKFRNSCKRTKLLLPQDETAYEVLSEFTPNLVVAKIIFHLYMDDV